MIKFVQGDVVMKPIEGIPEGFEKVDTKIVQPSETHGKFHRFADNADNVSVYVGKEQANQPGVNPLSADVPKVVCVDSKGAYLFHGKAYDYNPSTQTETDHAALFLPPGTYEVGIVSEYNYDEMEVRKVVD